MAAIPREQEIHAMHCGEGNVKGIFRGRFGNGPISKQPIGQPFDFRIHGQLRDVDHRRPTAFGGLRITSDGFPLNYRGDEEIKAVTVIVPPSFGNLLAS